MLLRAHAINPCDTSRHHVVESEQFAQPRRGTEHAVLRGMTTDSGVRDPQTFAIIGAAMAVHTELGCGFLESVYRSAMMVELDTRRIPFRTEVPFAVKYKERPLPLNYRADLVCFESVVVEVKALRAIGPIEQAQAINYLKASGLPRGVILNFGARSLEYRRVVLSLRAAV
jgi:GxxExxY protein